MLKSFITYENKRQFLEALDLEIDYILNERVYDSPDAYLNDIRRVWNIATEYAKFSNDSGLPHIETDYTGNKMLSLMLDWLEVKLQS